MFSTVIYEKKDSIATISLNRPEVINAYNTQMRDDLYEVLQAVREDRDVQGVILTGLGPKGFSAGADLAEFGSSPSQVIARDVRRERDTWELLSNLSKPIVAAIHGYCLGLARLLIEKITSYPESAVQAIKATVHQGMDMPLGHALALEKFRALTQIVSLSK